MDAQIWQAFVTLVTAALLGLAAIVVARLDNQAKRDSHRRIFRLVFPGELKPEQALSYIRSVAGRKSNYFRLLGTSNVVYELLSDSGQIIHRVRVPWPSGKYVIKQLRSNMAGIRVTEDRTPDTFEWSGVQELSMTDPAKMLDVDNPEDVTRRLLTVMQEPKDKEALLFQLVLSPSVRFMKPRPVAEQRRAKSAQFNPSGDAINDARAKLKEPNFSVLVRIAAKAATKQRTQHLIWLFAMKRGPGCC